MHSISGADALFASTITKVKKSFSILSASWPWRWFTDARKQEALMPLGLAPTSVMGKLVSPAPRVRNCALQDSLSNA